MIQKYLLLFLFSTNIYSADKFLFVLGGGGDPKGETTIFDDEVKRLSNFSKNSAWKTEVYFDGGHKKTEQILKDSFQDSYKGDFVKLNYDKFLNDLKSKILSSQIKPGDQMMIVLNSHGYVKSQNERTHSVSLAKSNSKDLVNLKGADVVSIDTLNEVMKLAEDRGVRLAFVDESCHSGSSLNLKLNLKKSCIISATGPTLMGIIDGIDPLKLNENPDNFVSRFNHGLKNSSNLEDLFLKSRELSSGHDFPMISTPEGMEIQNLLYDLMSPYFKYNTESVQKFGSEYDVTTINTLTCSNQRNYNQVINLLDSLYMMKDLSLSLSDFESLKKSLREYRNYQIKYEQSYLRLKTVSDKILNQIKKKFPNEAKLFAEKDGVSILDDDYENSVKVNEAMLKAASDSKYKKDWQILLDNSKAKLQIVKEVKKSLTSADMSLINENKEMIASNTVTYSLASNVLRDMRLFYKSMYSANRTKEGNACRDFSL